MAVWVVLAVRGLGRLRPLLWSVFGAVVTCVLLAGWHRASLVLGLIVGALCYGWGWTFGQALGNGRSGTGGDSSSGQL